MKWVDKLERKFGRYAISNIMLYLVVLELAGYVISSVQPMFYYQYLSLNMEAILHGQIWRLVTFLMSSSASNLLFLLLGCLAYYYIGQLMEQIMGVFRFNLYLLTGILGHILAALVIYILTGLSVPLTVSQLYMSMFLVVAITVPERKFVLLLFGLIPIPVKAKYLGVFYAVLLVISLIQGSWLSRLTILLSMLNFILYLVSMRRRPMQKVTQMKRRADYQKKTQAASNGPRHRCAVCGRTEADDPNLEFRYCSKCDGGQEYCLEHLYTHVHVTNGGDSHEEN